MYYTIVIQAVGSRTSPFDCNFF